MATQQQESTRTVLHVSKITPRVLENRRAHDPAFITFGKFRKGLVRAFNFDLRALSSFPKGFWRQQYEAYNHGNGRVSILDQTVTAFAWADRAYNTKKG